jgi:glutamate carboxypeptidase
MDTPAWLISIPIMRRRIVSLLISSLALSRVASAAPLNAEEQRVIAAAETGFVSFGAELEQIAQINSVTENLAGVRQLGDYFIREFQVLGFDSRFEALPASTGRAGHFVAERNGARGKRLLLIGHLDTVLPGGNFRREGDMVFGAGVADMKGGNLVILHALRALHRAGFLENTHITVVFTGDEESPGVPLDITRRSLREAAKRTDLALAFESDIPGTGTIARRGLATWELEVQGPTGHSSGIFSQAMGSGAVYEAARILSMFHAEIRRIDGVTLNPGLIVGGAQVELDRTTGTVSGKTNIVAQRVLVRGDLRFFDAEQFAEARAGMERALHDRFPRTSAKLTFHDGGYPAMPSSDANTALLAELDRASRDLGFGPITAFDPRGRGAGDVSFVSPPLPALDGLGLGGTGEHTTAEAADLKTAPALIKRTALLIYRLTR